MNTYLILIPAESDFDSAADVQAAWDAGEDFIVTNTFNQHNRRPINKARANKVGYKVKIRYNNLTRVCKVK